MQTSRLPVVLAAVFAIIFAGFASQVPGTGQAAVTFPSVALVPVGTGFSSPTSIGSAGDDRLFVTEQEGTIRFIRNGARVNTPFLDISSRVKESNEEGLLGLAFPRGYSAKQWFYVYYSDNNGDIVVSRFRTTANPDVADSNSEVPVLRIPHPFNANHNGGALVFGPDNMLYIGVGDGGASGDPPNNGQTRTTLLGKVLRIDAEAAAPDGTYAIPANNPYFGQTAFRGEIWAFGLRNPWRISFDRATDELYIADVGQNEFEEVNAAPGTLGGINYGWKLYEGNECFSGPCNPAGLTMPIVTYPHCGSCAEGGSSITGGYVYRGGAYPNLNGFYIFGDYVNGNLFATKKDGTAWPYQRIIDTNFLISSFGEDTNGELYIASYGNGTIYRITDSRATAVPVGTRVLVGTPRAGIPVSAVGRPLGQ